MESAYESGVQAGEDFLGLASVDQAEALKIALIDNELVRICALIEEVTGAVFDDEVYDRLWIEGLRKTMHFPTKIKIKDASADNGVEILQRWVKDNEVIALRDLVKEVIAEDDYTNIFAQFAAITEKCDAIYDNLPDDDAAITPEIAKAYEDFASAVASVYANEELPTDEDVYFEQLEREEDYSDDDYDDEDEDGGGYSDEEDYAEENYDAEALMTDISQHYIPDILRPLLRKINVFLKAIGYAQ